MLVRSCPVRLAAFRWLKEQVGVHGEILDVHLLRQGFQFRGQRVPLLGPQGIFKPKLMDTIPLSITTSPNGPYRDAYKEDGLLEYCYRGNDPNHHENRGLREAFRTQTPLVYFHGIVPGRYFAVWPVFIVGDDPRSLVFQVAVDDAFAIERSLATSAHPRVSDADSGRREYITAATKIRVHQGAFRLRVLRAYREQCALCRLQHSELLDAAHIIPDSHPQGDPVVRNGLSLCKLHHAAFDKNVLGISPDFRVEIREDILREVDGPMLKHGIQGIHGQQIILPRSKAEWPDQERLAFRYEAFRSA